MFVFILVVKLLVPVWIHDLDLASLVGLLLCATQGSVLEWVGGQIKVWHTSTEMHIALLY